jgi:hypothetical protein
VQVVNKELAIFDKTSGSPLTDAIPLMSMWKGFGETCEVDSTIDPIVLFDKIANRWLLAHMGSYDPSIGAEYICIALSTSSDARGSYNRYVFPIYHGLDYAKFGVWSDGYYMSNEGKQSACVFDRDSMLSGSKASMQCATGVQENNTDRAILPSDFDGAPPPIGAPNYFATIDFFNKDFNTMHFYKFHVDWKDVAKSSFTGEFNVAIAPFMPAASIPQKGTSNQLSSHPNLLMYRLSYRKHGDNVSLLLNHTVESDNDTAGIRWYEFRIDNGQNISLYQQGTFCPDNLHRWMGSVAMDKVGNIAIEYNISSKYIFPGIRISGRAPTDPFGYMRDEKII